jgi:hypothetical protein
MQVSSQAISSCHVVQIGASPTLRAQLESRVSVCEGVRIFDRGNRWITLPTDTWRPASREEWECLEFCYEGESDPSRAIGLFEMTPDALARSVEFLEWYFAAPNRQLPECRAKGEQIKLLESIYAGTDADDVFMGVASAPANRSTVAMHRDTGEPVGLHIDNYDGLHVRKRVDARNRICVNVGRQSRYLLFLPFQTDFLLSQVALHPEATAQQRKLASGDHRELVHQYFRLHPDSLIYRIEMAPGEGYVAPTENIIHEGSTLGTEARDYSMVWLGRFRWSGVRSHSE